MAISVMFDAGAGRRFRHFPDAAAALAHAKRLQARIGGQVEVVWCKYPHDPKLWLAFVSPAGVTLTDFGRESGLSV